MATWADFERADRAIATSGRERVAFDVIGGPGTQAPLIVFELDLNTTCAAALKV